MSTELTTPTANNQLAEAKRKPWGDLGVAIFQEEQTLNLMAQQSLLKVTNPKHPEDVQMAELCLADMKKDFQNIQDRRKGITEKFRAVSDRLMAPEKSLLQPIEDFGKAIIAIKKADEGRVATERAKQEETSKLIEYVCNETAKLDAKFKTIIADRIGKAYEHALGAGKVTALGLKVYLDLIVERVTVKDFPNTIPAPKLVHVSQDEFNKILFENCSLAVTAETYVDMWKEELAKRFSDYEVAVNNKKQALEIAQKEAEAKAIAQAEEVKNKEAAAKLASMAVEPIIKEDFKDLKKPYRIAMEENAENAIKILSATVANWGEASKRIGVKKWFNFSVANAMVALEKMKNEDRNFAPQGITFEQYDKL